jgi:hypothetical protein
VCQHEHGNGVAKIKDNSTYPVFHHGNFVRTPCDGKSMCDKQHRFHFCGIPICAGSTGDRINRLKYFVLGVGIKSGGLAIQETLPIGIEGKTNKGRTGSSKRRK